MMIEFRPKLSASRCYDPEELQDAKSAFDDVWQELTARGLTAGDDDDITRQRLARTILFLTASGRNDSDAVKERAIRLMTCNTPRWVQRGNTRASKRVKS